MLSISPPTPSSVAFNVGTCSGPSAEHDFAQLTVSTVLVRQRNLHRERSVSFCSVGGRRQRALSRRATKSIWLSKPAEQPFHDVLDRQRLVVVVADVLLHCSSTTRVSGR